MSPTITRNVLSGPRPIARAVAPRLPESHQNHLESPECDDEPENCLDQMVADLAPAASYSPPHIDRPKRPPPTHFHPKALSAKPTPKPLSRRKVEPPPPVEGALMTSKEVAAILRISEKALEHLRRRGTGPKHVSISGTGRSVRYRTKDLDAYLTGLADQGGH